MTNPIYRFKVGAFQCINIDDKTETAPASRFFPTIVDDELNLILRENDYPNELPVSTNCLLIDTGEKRVLIDTGYGIETTLGGQLLNYLDHNDISPDTIDVVALTHAHLDHYGAMTLANGDKVFPNAEYIMWRDEWDHYTSEDHLAVEKERAEGQLAFIQKYFLSIKDHLRFVSADNTEIIPGINAIYAPGHTRHHIAVQVESNNESLLLIGDAMIHPLHFNYTDWHWAFEYDGEQLKQTRKMLTEIALDTNALIHAYHFPAPGLGRISKDGDRIVWNPVGS